jgi:hypothetical protein
MYVCMYMWICLSMYSFECLHEFVYISVYKYVYVCTCVYRMSYPDYGPDTWNPECQYVLFCEKAVVTSGVVRIGLFMRVYMCVLLVCMYLCACIYMHVCTLNIPKTAQRTTHCARSHIRPLIIALTKCLNCFDQFLCMRLYRVCFFECPPPEA